MFYLTGNSENVIYTSVSSVKELSSPTYLMSLTHSQTGRKWSFIPQNITPQSGTPYNQRYDLFQFNISGGTENLTGGTNAFYYQLPPAFTYSDVRYSGTNEVYLLQFPVVPYSFGSIGLKHDFPDYNEEITASTVTFDGNVISSTFNRYASPFGNFQEVFIIVNGAMLDYSGKIEFEYETNSGNSFNKVFYLNSMNEVSTYEPWKYYGYPSLAGPVRVTLPTTHLTPPVVNIDEIGEFRYSIYEQVNPVNLNTSVAYNQLEVGLAYITEGFTDIFYDNNDTSDVYNP